MEPVRQTLSYLQERLLKEERRFAADDEEIGVFSTIADNRSKVPEKHQGRQENSRKCYHDQRGGHIAKQSWFRTQENNRRKTNRHNVTDAGQSHRAQFNQGSISNQRFADAFTSTVTVGTDRAIEGNATYQGPDISAKALRGLWITDSGASRHICCRKVWYHNLKFFPDSQKVNIILGDGNVHSAEGSGTIQILRRVNNK